MKKIEGPQVMASILAILAITIAVIFAAPDQIEKIAVGAITAIGMLGMKLLEKNGKTE